MTQSQIVALRCPSCGGELSEPSSGDVSPEKFTCNVCGTTSMNVIERSESTEKPWIAEARTQLAAGNAPAAIRIVHKANQSMSLAEAKAFVDTLS